MNKDILEIKIVDLLEQAQGVDKLIALYGKQKNDAIAASMIQQYSVRKQEIVEQLNQIFKKFSLRIVNNNEISSAA